MPTALVINVDQAKSEIIALNTAAAVVEAPVAQAAPVAVAETKAAVTEKPVVVKEEKPTTTTKAQESHKPRSADRRASNDPRMRSRQKRENQAKQQAPAPKLNPSQVPTLSQYTVGSLIRHVYGEDCSVLIEQFGLIPTFNRALVKFTEQYAATIVHQETEAEAAQPVTRDVAVTKAAPEAEPAPVLDLTPPTAISDKRVANDPRERRRLAKLAAEQALEQAKQAHSEPEATKDVATIAPEVVETAVTEIIESVTEQVTAIEDVAIVDEPKVAAEPVIKAEKPAPVAKVVEPKPVEAKPVQAETAVDVAQDVQALAEPKTDANKDETEDDEDKPIRPRRPRGRPPKKATPANES
jgi:ribonuclease E